jgi:hypothetical protein
VRVLEIEKGISGSPSVGSSLWNILWTSRKTDSGMKELRRVLKVYYADEYNPDDNVKLETYIRQHRCKYCLY